MFYTPRKLYYYYSLNVKSFQKVYLYNSKPNFIDGIVNFSYKHLGLQILSVNITIILYIKISVRQKKYKIFLFTLKLEKKLFHNQRILYYHQLKSYNQNA